MLFNPSPSGFRTKHWRALYESHISDLPSLKQAVHDGAMFVFIDAEPWGQDLSKPAEIGISLLSSPGHFKDDTNTWTLDGTVAQYGIETHWIRVLGRERKEKGRQPHRFGQRHEVADDQIEEEISNIVSQFAQQHSHTSRETPVILSGFSLHFELVILSGLYPKVLQCFTAWMDLQKVVCQFPIEDDKTIMPSLRGTMIACGFQEMALQNVRNLHNAACDTTQTAALLIRLTTIGDGEILDIKRSGCKKHTGRRMNPLKRRVWEDKPFPRELFPYTAKLSRSTGFDNFKTAQPLLVLFEKHLPVAVGLQRGKKYGWVCLPDFDALEGFVRQVNKSTIDGDVWTAVSLYDDTIVPAKDQWELKARKKAVIHALADKKRKQRKLKAANGDVEEDEMLLGMGMD